MTSKTPRTGNQYSIHHGDYSAVICELGAKIRRFDFNGKEIFLSTNITRLRATTLTMDTPTTTCGSSNRSPTAP